MPQIIICLLSLFDFQVSGGQQKHSPPVLRCIQLQQVKRASARGIQPQCQAPCEMASCTIFLQTFCRHGDVFHPLFCLLLRDSIQYLQSFQLLGSISGVACSINRSFNSINRAFCRIWLYIYILLTVFSRLCTIFSYIFAGLFGPFADRVEAFTCFYTGMGRPIKNNCRILQALHAFLQIFTKFCSFSKDFCRLYQTLADGFQDFFRQQQEFCRFWQEFLQLPKTFCRITLDVYGTLADICRIFIKILLRISSDH